MVDLGGADARPDPRRGADRHRLAERVLVQRPDRHRRRVAGRVRAPRAGATERAAIVRPGRVRAVPRRPARAHGLARIRRPVRLDDGLGPGRDRGLLRRAARVPVGRVPQGRAAARPQPVPQPPVRDGQPGLAAQRDRPQRGAVPARVLPAGREGRRSGHGRDPAGTARRRPARAVPDQRGARRSLRIAAAGDRRDARDGPRADRPRQRSRSTRRTGSWRCGS